MSQHYTYIHSASRRRNTKFAKFDHARMLAVIDEIVEFMDFDFRDRIDIAVGRVRPQKVPGRVGVCGMDECHGVVVVLFGHAEVPLSVSSKLANSILVSIGKSRTSSNVADKGNDYDNDNANGRENEVISCASTQHPLFVDPEPVLVKLSVAQLAEQWIVERSVLCVKLH